MDLDERKYLHKVVLSGRNVPPEFFNVSIYISQE